MDIFASWDKIGAVAGMIAATVAIVFGVRNALNGYRLLRRMNAGQTRGGRRAVLKTLFYIGLRNFGALLLREERFLRHVRIRVEHEIFEPRPVWQWPLADDDDNYKKPGFSLDFRGKSMDPAKVRREARTATKKAFGESMREWRAKMAELNIGDSEKLPRIELKLAGELNDNLSEIKRYFDTLKTLGLGVRELKFLCPVSVNMGFIASQHLLSGLLVRFNDKWDHIIRGFEMDSEAEGLHLDALPRDLRQVQSFIYYCWLLWGPSIPICAHSCDAWNADFATLQFGYGDENNSIELVGEHEWLKTQFDDLLKKRPANGAMAVPASVWGELQYSSIVDAEQAAIPAALREAWRGGQDERPILFLSRGTQGERLDGQKYERPGGIGTEDPPFRKHQSRYYSSYLWAMFVLLKNVGTAAKPAWVPVDPKDKKKPFKQASASPWMTAIPFFEHGNLADPQTCRFSKEQLAEKALGGLTRLAELLPAKAPGYKFAYVCAIDDANCSQPLAFDALVGGDTVAAIMAGKLEREPARYATKLIDLRHYESSEEAGFNPHSACHQTEWVSQHYAALEKLRQD